MNEGGIVGATSALWLAGNCKTTVEMLQDANWWGAANAGVTNRRETSDKNLKEDIAYRNSRIEEF